MCFECLIGKFSCLCQESTEGEWVYSSMAPLLVCMFLELRKSPPTRILAPFCPAGNLVALSVYFLSFVCVSGLLSK